MVLPGDKLGVKIHYIGMRYGWVVVKVETTNERGRKVFDGSAEVTQPTAVEALKCVHE
jgi:fatty acid synthase subunit alpha, fungi type